MVILPFFHSSMASIVHCRHTITGTFAELPDTMTDNDNYAHTRDSSQQEYPDDNDRITSDHVPSTWSTLDNACTFCHGGSCQVCPETAFHSVFQGSSSPLYLGLPGWHCCSCETCVFQLNQARMNHVVPQSLLDQLFERLVKISDDEFASPAAPTWQILCAFRTNWSGLSGHCTTAVVWRRINEQARPQRLPVSLEMIAKCNPSDNTDKYTLLKRWV